jgi:histone-binding protein RBBP4
MVRKPSHAQRVSCTCPVRKKNAPYLYDLMITHALDWPSLTCQWFPDKESCVYFLSLSHLAMLLAHLDRRLVTYARARAMRPSQAPK